MASSSEASAGRRLNHDEGSQNLMRLHVEAGAAGKGRQNAAGSRKRPQAGAHDRLVRACASSARTHCGGTRTSLKSRAGRHEAGATKGSGDTRSERDRIQVRPMRLPCDAPIQPSAAPPGSPRRRACALRYGLMKKELDRLLHDAAARQTCPSYDSTWRGSRGRSATQAGRADNPSIRRVRACTASVSASSSRSFRRSIFSCSSSISNSALTLIS